MCELPNDIRENKNVRVFDRFDQTGKLRYSYRREVDLRDAYTFDTYEGVTKKIPIYHGEWYKVPQEEIDKINIENHKTRDILAFNNRKVRKASTLSTLEKRIRRGTSFTC